MAWVAVHPDLTEEFQVPEGEGPTFEIGFWPPRVAERLGVVWGKLAKPEKELDPVTDQEEYLQAIGLKYEIAYDMVRYAVRNWTGFVHGDARIAPVFDTISQNEPEPVLSAESMRWLHVNKLTAGLALKCMLFNMLTEDQKKTLNWRSDSSSSKTDTDVESATTSGKGMAAAS